MCLQKCCKTRRRQQRRISGQWGASFIRCWRECLRLQQATSNFTFTFTFMIDDGVRRRETTDEDIRFRYQVFQKILGRQFEYPDKFPEDARDLCDLMLQVNPDDRPSIEEIHAHAFFEGIDWEGLPETEVPEIKTGFAPKKEVTSSSAGASSSGTETGQVDSSEISAERQEKLEEQKSSMWAKFLFPNELIVHTGLVWKRKGLSIKKRQLILTDFPRLIYIDPVKMDQKGEIVWSDNLRAEMKNNRTFFVHTPQRTYYLDDISCNAEAWINAVTELQLKNSS
eukprot:TRINITY_DN3012_c0_g2_i3.p1 TRINITY_DN3012_c0_g2~~TRINITY_DN3012_c0_g2_i3.p1  ORF type:complete len:282 (+),score=64.05 TRINITY_DN3012_c0_g2_i3:219-1064(+)